MPDSSLAHGEYRLSVMKASLSEDLICRCYLLDQVSFLPDIWGREMFQPWPYLECPHLPANTWLLQGLRLCAILVLRD